VSQAATQEFGPVKFESEDSKLRIGFGSSDFGVRNRNSDLGSRLAYEFCGKDLFPDRKKPVNNDKKLCMERMNLWISSPESRQSDPKRLEYIEVWPDWCATGSPARMGVTAGQSQACAVFSRVYMRLYVHEKRSSLSSHLFLEVLMDSWRAGTCNPCFIFILLFDNLVKCLQTILRNAPDRVFFFKVGEASRSPLCNMVIPLMRTELHGQFECTRRTLALPRTEMPSHSVRSKTSLARVTQSLTLPSLAPSSSSLKAFQRAS
jgi:hypothetical protein